MREPLPILMVPGLLCSARLYRDQVPELWRIGPITLVDPTRDDTLQAMARRMLATAPPQFALVGLSMGGYLAFEVLRQAPERVLRLGLLDTSARADTPEQSAQRRALIVLAREGRFSDIVDTLFPRLVHPDHLRDPALRRVVQAMANDVGPEAFVRQQSAILQRPDSRPELPAIHCPTLVLVGDADAITPPDVAREMSEAIAGSRLVVVPRAGHASTLEAPEAVTRELVAFLTA
jgi:pimeloyl-ACP methyl ester carboxylesterase